MSGEEQRSGPCRGCAGTGITARISPREHQLAMQKVHMVKTWPSEYNGVKSIGMVRGQAAPRSITEQHKDYVIEGSETVEGPDGMHTFKQAKAPTRAYARVDPWHGGSGPKAYSSRLAMSGSYAYVIEHVEKRLADGFEIEPGSMRPDPALLCEWCNGLGEATGQLTVNNLEEALSQTKGSS